MRTEQDPVFLEVQIHSRELDPYPINPNFSSEKIQHNFNKLIIIFPSEPCQYGPDRVSVPVLHLLLLLTALATGQAGVLRQADVCWFPGSGLLSEILYFSLI